MFISFAVQLLYYRVWLSRRGLVHNIAKRMYVMQKTILHWPNGLGNNYRAELNYREGIE